MQSKFFDKFLLDLRLKHLDQSDYIEFETEHKENFEESVHKTFFALLIIRQHRSQKYFYPPSKTSL